MMLGMILLATTLTNVQPYDILHDKAGHAYPKNLINWQTVDGVRILKLNGGGQCSWKKLELEPYRNLEVEFVLTFKTVNAKRRLASWDKSGKTLEPFKPACWHWEHQHPAYSSWTWPEIVLPESGTTDGWVTKSWRTWIAPHDDLSRAGGFLTANLLPESEVYVKEFTLRPVETPFMDTIVQKAGAEIPDGFKCTYSSKWLDGKKYRGTVMIWTFSPADIDKVAGWGCNLIRMSRFAPLKDDYARLEKNLAACQKNGIRVIFAPAAPGARGNRRKYSLFNDDQQREDYLKGWEKLATYFKGRSDIWAFGLLNEPFQSLFGNTSDKYNYWQLQYEAIKRIRAIDPERPIVATADIGGSPSDYALAYMRPFPFKDVWYEIHFYSPVCYTHDQVLGKKMDFSKPGQTWPGLQVFRDERWNKDTLTDLFNQSKPFAEKYGAKYFVGEFSVVRCVPGAENWLDDVSSIVDSQVDLWTYHSYGEFHGWNLEYDEDSPYKKPQKTPPGVESRRLKVMKKHWNKGKGM